MSKCVETERFRWPTMERNIDNRDIIGKIPMLAHRILQALVDLPDAEHNEAVNDPLFPLGVSPSFLTRIPNLHV